jgi:hypothetical protein
MRRFGASLAVLVVGLEACRGELRFDDHVNDAGVSADAPGDAPRLTGPCTKDGDCGLATLHCDVAEGRCVACTSDSHCEAPTGRCDPALLRCVGCVSSDDCTSPASCDPVTRQCLVACREEDDPCPNGLHCNERMRRCATCAESSHCERLGARLSCDVLTGRCITCRTDASCNGGRCDTFLGRCVACLSAADCPTTAPTCDVRAGLCVPRP